MIVCPAPRKIVIASREVSTLAGTAGVWGYTDATGSAARFSSPYGVTTYGTNLYVADRASIRKVVVASGEVTTLAGSSGASSSTDGTGSTATFSAPDGITTDGTNLYVADSSSHTIRKVVIATGVVTTLAGSPGVSGSAEGCGR